MTNEQEIQKTIDILNDRLNVSEDMLTKYSQVNRELRSFNDDLASRIRRLEKENAQCIRAMQMMLKIINFCEKNLNNVLDQKLEENHERAKATEKE